MPIQNPNTNVKTMATGELAEVLRGDRGAAKVPVQDAVDELKLRLAGGDIAAHHHLELAGHTVDRPPSIDVP